MRSRSFKPSPFFAFRTPLLPFDSLESWTAGATAPGLTGEPRRLDEAVARDAAMQRRRLRDLLERPEVREAIFLASPSLDEALTAWFDDPEGEKGRRAERAVVKYVSRMASRATPFGLFAGTSVGRIGTRTRLRIEPLSSGRRRSRLDTDYVLDLAAAFGRDPSLRCSLTFRPNSTIYPAGGRLRYVETRAAGNERTHHLVAVEDTPELRSVLERSRDGETLDRLAAGLIGKDVEGDDAEAYVLELVEAQVLVPGVGTALTGADPARALAKTLRREPGTTEFAARLEEVVRGLQGLDDSGLGAEPGRYRELASVLSGFPVEADPSRLFQVDLVYDSPGVVLGDEVLGEVQRGVELLHRLMPPRGSDLRLFREAFDERYGQREVPLVEALDEESGIGYPAYAEEDSSDSPLLRGIPFPELPDGTARWGRREAHLLRKLSFALSSGADEIVLDAADVEALSNPAPAPLPGAFAALVRVAASSDEALDRGDFRVVIESAGGPSGARFLGRFCHADPDLERLVGEHLRAEEALDPEAIFAEVVHLPEGRSGNVVRRPLFRDYEIPYVGESGAPPDRQIPVSDLLVSVRGDEIRLRSRRLGRRVIPRMTAAHNYVAYGLCAYRFLCALQAQTTAGGLLWDWGALGKAPFLPRVRRGRTVFSAARWVARQDELAPLASVHGAERFRAISAWRAERGVPRYALVADMAEELLVDFDSVLSVEAFVHLAKGAGPVELKELLPAPADLCARGREGRYAHELLVPFVLTAEPGPAVPDGRFAASEPPPDPASCRTCPPGSEWLYAKLYGGSATLDRVLRDTVGPLSASLVASGVADRWFFVRYADPRTHLRLRLHGTPERLRNEALPALEKEARRLIDQGLVWRMQLDTYEREIERYGGPEGLDLAERVFHHDSDSVVELLGMLEEGLAGEEERWRLAVVGADFLMADLGLPVCARHDLVRDLRGAFGEEHHEDATLRRALAGRWREHRVEIEALLEDSGGPGTALAPGINVFRRRSARLAPIISEARVLAGAGRLGQSAASLAASHVHMFLNRIFSSGHRRQELIVYELLLRAYTSLQSRAGGHPVSGVDRGTGNEETGKWST